MRHKFNLKRIVSFLLVLVMIAGFVPDPANALISGFEAGSGTWTLTATGASNNTQFINHNHRSSLSQSEMDQYNGNYWRIISNTPATKTTEGEFTIQCTACDAIATFKIPKWTDSMYNWTMSYPTVYDGKTPTTESFALTNPAAIVTASDGTAWSYFNLIGQMNTHPAEIQNAGVYPGYVWNGTFSIGVSDPATGQSFAHLKISTTSGQLGTTPETYIIQPREVALTVSSKYMAAPGGGSPWLLETATGANILPSITATFPNYLGTATKANIYAHKVTGFTVQPDGQSFSMDGDTYVTDDTASKTISSITEPGFYNISAVLPLLASPSYFMSNYSITTNHPADLDIYGSSFNDNAGNTYYSNYIELFRLFVAPSSLPAVYVQERQDNLVTTYPASSDWNFRAVLEDSPGTSFLSTAGTKNVLLIVTPKNMADQTMGIATVTMPIEVKKWNAYALKSTPVASNPTPVVGTAFADLGLPATVDVIFETPVGYNSTYGKDNVKVAWDASSWDPTNPSQQVVIGHLDLANDPASDAVMLDPYNLTVQVTITPRSLETGDVTFPPKTVEYTGSPIPHEITSATGVASTTYRYVSAAAGYDSATPPSAVGTYQVTATFTMQAGYAQLAPVISTLTITPKQQLLPAGSKPVVDYVTPISITLKPAEGDGTWEYGRVLPNGTISWQDDLTFTGLSPDTEYQFVQRLKGNPPTVDPSETSEVVSASTIAATMTVDVAATAKSVKYPDTIELSAMTTHNLGQSATVSYQWYKAGIPVAGATRSTLTLTETTDSGTYTCEATVTLGDYTMKKMSDSLTVEITSGSIFDLLPDNWQDYLITDPIVYGQTLADTNLRFDMARLLADHPECTKATTLAIRFTTPTRVPTVTSSISGKGTYSVSITSSDPNYPNTETSTIPETDITVTPAPLTIKLNDFEIEYGESMSNIENALRLNYTGFVNGDSAASLTGTLTYSSDYKTQWQDIPAGGSVEMTIGGLSSDNYNITFESGRMTIRPKEIHVVPDYGQQKQYGESDPTFKLSALNIASLPADVQAAIAAALPSVPVSREAGENVGLYDYEIPTTVIGNFSFTRYMRDVPGQFEIVRRKVPVVWDIASDSDNPVPPIVDIPDIDSGLSRDDIAIGTIIPIMGSLPIIMDGVDGGGSDGLTNKANLITAYYIDKDGNRVPLTIKFTSNGVPAVFNHPGLFFADADDTSADANNYELIGDLRQFLYQDPTKTENVTFPTASTIYEGDKLRDSELTGGNGGETGTGTYEWANPTYVPEIGTWLFDVIFTPGPDDNTDYSTERGWDPDTHTITRKVPVTVKARQAVDPDLLDITTDKVYDGTSTAEVDASKAITIVPGDNVTVKVTARYDTPDAGDNKTIYIKIEVSGPDADKYNVPDEFTIKGSITPAPLTIKANDAHQAFGDELGNTGVTLTGLVAGETIANLSGTLVYDYDGYSRWDDVFSGSKTITVSGLTSQNYNITYETGLLTVSKRTILILPDIMNYKFYGDPEPVYIYNVHYGYPGTAPAKVREEIDNNPVTISRAPGEDVGNYKFICEAADTTNFTWAIDDDITFRIVARPVDLTWVGVNNPYYEDGTNQSSFIGAWYQDITGKQVFVPIIFTKNGSDESVPFITKGEYDLTAVMEDRNYVFNNPTNKAYMLDESDRNKLTFPIAVPILKGEDLGQSDLIGGIGNGDFSWVDPSIVPDATGSFPVRFTPAGGEDMTQQPGYDPSSGTVIRDVEVEVWDGPWSPDPSVWDDIKKNGLLDKYYNADTDTLIRDFDGTPSVSIQANGPVFTLAPAPTGAALMNTNTTEQILTKSNAFWETYLGDKNNLVYGLIYNNLLGVDLTGTYESKSVGENRALAMSFALSGKSARLFDFPAANTSGDIDEVRLIVLANDQKIETKTMPTGAGVTFPSAFKTDGKGYPAKFQTTWDNDASVTWVYGLAGTDSQTSLGGLLTYRFVAVKADGTEVAYNVNDMYAVPIWIVPQGLTSSDYNLSFMPGKLSAPNIFDPNDYPNWPSGRPDAPTIKETTTTSIEVNPIPGGQYSIDGGKTWQDSPLFPGLTPDTEYEIIQRIPDKNNPGEYLVSDPTTAKTRDPNDNPNRPNPPQIKDKDDTSITLIPIPDGEYSIDGGKTWQPDPYFPGLTPGTEYEIIQRIPDPDNPDEYLVSDPTRVKTDETDPDANKPPKPVVKDKDDTSITLVPIPDGEYSIDGGETWQPDPYFPGLKPGTDYEIIQRIPDPSKPGEYIESDPTYVRTDEDPDANKPPKPVVKDKDDTSITLVPIPDGEYSIDGGKTWQPDPYFPGLKPGTDYEIIQRWPDPSNPGEYIESDPTHVRTDEDPDANKPPKPEIEDVNENTIIVKPIPDGEYSIDGGETWQPSPIFPGLKPGTDYEIIQRWPDPNNPGEYIESDPTDVRTDDPSSNGVPDPIVVDKKPDSITLLPIDNGEYSADGGMTWQPAPYFPGLTPNTKYDIVQRVPNGNGGYDISDKIEVTTPGEQDWSDIKTDKPSETIQYPDGKYEITDENGNPIKPGDPIKPGSTIHVKDPSTGNETDIKIPNRPAAPDVSLDNETGIINTKPGMEYSPDGGKTWLPAPDGLDINDITDGEIWVRYPATDDDFASEPAIIPIKRPSAPIVSGMDVSSPGASDGAILGVDTSMEYSTDGGKTWKPCPDGLVSNLPQGTYLVRYKGTADHLASLPATVVIGVRRQTASSNNSSSDSTSPDDKYGHWVQPGRPNNFGSNNNGNLDDTTTIIDGDVALGGMAGCPSEPYLDIDRSQWYHDPCDFTISNGLMIGFNSSEWGPTRQMTRFQMVQVLYRLAGSPAGYSLDGVADVPRDSWYYNALAWAYAAGMVKGVTEDLFAPDDSITYEQMATMLYNFCNVYGLTYMTGTATTSYNADEVADYAKAPMTAIAATGIFNVRGTTSVSAKSSMSRATAAMIVTNFCTLYNNQMRSNDNITGATQSLYTNPGVMSSLGVLFS